MRFFQRSLASARIAAFLLFVVLLLPGFGPRGADAQVTTTSGGSTFTWSDGYAIVQHQLPTPRSEPWAITSDPAGKVWFLEQGTGRLGAYDPASGNFQEYPIPTGGSELGSVASDSLGNIWFTELSSNMLGELPAGGKEIREFPVPGTTVNLGGSTQTLACGPGAILPDPSGTVLLACLFSDQIDEFFPVSNTYSQFSLPVFQSGPAGLLLDHKGNLWFTAADSNMLGKAVISQLKNGTSLGISEFPPLNQTYAFRFAHPTSFLGSTSAVSSSLPTPSGIAMDGSGRLWITEHVDSSFDSYDPTTGSLVKYWTSQTFGRYGYTVSFPNGIAVDANGTVWIGEHYGNKIAAFVPSSGSMTEFPVPCCTSSSAGVYSVALGPSGRLWFVEIAGNAIGEMVPRPSQHHLSLTLPRSSVSLDSGGSATIPIQFSYSSASGGSAAFALSVAGVSATGALQNMTAGFSSSDLNLTSGATASTNLTLSLQGISPGVYYLTLSAAATPGGAIHSVVLKLTVDSGPGYPIQVVVASVVGVGALAAAAGWVLARRVQRPAVRSRPLSLLSSLTTARTRSPTPTPRPT